MDARTGMILNVARQMGVTDPYAALAVSHMEGFGGGIGDSGTSFGPFQLHIGGAMPSGIANPGQWAWSPAGLQYALRQIAGVSRGLRGQAAINAIVSRFERPAAPGPEIAGALNWYRGNAGGTMPGPGAGLAAAPGAAAAGAGGGGAPNRAAAIATLMQFASGGQAGQPGQAANGFQQLFTALADQQAKRGDATHAPAGMPGSGIGVPQGGGGFDRPLPSMTITSGYGPRSGVGAPGESFHYGVDLAAPQGTPIHSLTAGKVLYAGMYGTGGYTVIMRDALGRTWFYHHMVSQPDVRVGQTLGAGSLLGGVGMTGDATGPHLHVGLQVNGKWADPTRFIKLAFRG